MAHLQLGAIAVPEPLPQSAKVRSPTAVFHGVLHNGTALGSSLQAREAPGSLSCLLAALYTRDGREFVDRLEGE